MDDDNVWDRFIDKNKYGESDRDRERTGTMLG